MSVSYFNEFPLVHYHGKLIRDITRKVKLRGVYTENADAYLPYVIEGDDRPEDIAHNYYGSVNYTWLVCLCNNVIDPYSDWVMTPSNFENMLMKKYAEKSGKLGHEIVDWTMNRAITDNIVYYEKDGKFYNPETIIINERLGASTAHTVDVMNSAANSGYRAIRVYDEEYEMNESKRHIMLLNEIFATKASEEFKGIMGQ